MISPLAEALKVSSPVCVLCNVCSLLFTLLIEANWKCGQQGSHVNGCERTWKSPFEQQLLTKPHLAMLNKDGPLCSLSSCCAAHFQMKPFKWFWERGGLNLRAICGHICSVIRPSIHLSSSSSSSFIYFSSISASLPSLTTRSWRSTGWGSFASSRSTVSYFHWKTWARVQRRQASVPYAPPEQPATIAPPTAAGPATGSSCLTLPSKSGNGIASECTIQLQTQRGGYFKQPHPFLCPFRDEESQTGVQLNISEIIWNHTWWKQLIALWWAY